MLLKNLTKVYVLESKEHNDHGEITKTWNKKSVAYLNLQQDLNELDRKTSGEIDYSIYKARTTIKYNIQKGDGILMSDEYCKDLIPEYRVMDINKIGQTFMYRLEKYNGKD